MQLRLWTLLALCLGMGFLSACSTDEDIRLSGERISVLSMQENLSADDVKMIPPMVLPEAWKNEFWPQAGGYPNHSMQHIALPADLNLAWSADMGEGSHKGLPLVAQPVVVNGLVVTMDARAFVRAFSAADGALVWEQGAGQKKKDESVITGGLAYGDQRIYVTTGFNELLALDYKTGALLWRQVLSGASQVAPSVLDGRVYVITIDNRLIALDGQDGHVLWDYASAQEGTGIVGGASPAVNRDVVIGAFSSGELAALRVENGSAAWVELLDKGSRLGGLGNIADIKALPVIDKGLLLAQNYSGRMAAIDLRSGKRVWQRDLGGVNTPWVAGDLIFALSSQNQLVAMHRQTGLIYWVKTLPSYREPAIKRGPLQWYGPVMAGGRLLLVSSDGEVVEYAPDTAQVVKRWDLDAPVRLTPLVAGERLYVLSDKGRLYVYQ